MPPQPPPTPRELWLATGRCFLLLAIGLTGYGVYEYYQFFWHGNEPLALYEWTFHWSLYDWGGPLAVLGFYLGVALVMTVASVLGYVNYYRLPPDPPKDKEPPT